MKQPIFLRIFEKGNLIAVKQFAQTPIVIGNGGEVQLSLENDSVSPIHSMIELRGNDYFLCDLGSNTGTFLKGVPILDEKIESSEEITVGHYTIEFFIGIPKPQTKPTGQEGGIDI
jgi:pSer/pThr/pTyr-binding forkhead associated (FHA) protein